MYINLFEEPSFTITEDVVPKPGRLHYLYRNHFSCSIFILQYQYIDYTFNIIVYYVTLEAFYSLHIEQHYQWHGVGLVVHILYVTQSINNSKQTLPYIIQLQS